MCFIYIFDFSRSFPFHTNLIFKFFTSIIFTVGNGHLDQNDKRRRDKVQYLDLQMLILVVYTLIIDPLDHHNVHQNDDHVSWMEGQSELSIWGRRRGSPISAQFSQSADAPQQLLIVMMVMMKLTGILIMINGQSKRINFLLNGLNKTGKKGNFWESALNISA